MPNNQDTEEFLKIYNEIDAFLRKQLRIDRYVDHSYLLQQAARTNRVVARFEHELKACAQLRNSLVHNPIGEVASPIAFPHPSLVKWYKAVRDSLSKPRLALSISIPASKIYTAQLDTVLNVVLKKMDENVYTHVPIIENDVMIGIFSENTLLSYLADNSETIILNDMKMADFKEYLPLKGHKGEQFCFLPRNATLNNVYDVFNSAITDHQRIGMLFLTENGKSNEKPLGIITAWDLASPEFELQLL